MPPKLLFDALLFGFLGLGLEVAFTGVLDYRKNGDKQLMGYSSLWYLPLYWLAPVFFHCAGPFVFPLPVWVRGCLYMACLFAFEYAGMGALRLLLGASPSEKSYYRSRWNVHGLIRLDFAPAWFAAGLFFELVYRLLR